MGQIADYRAAHGRITFGSPAQGVTLVQRALEADGASLVVDGEFGPITEQAVKAFQSRSNIVPVGWVGLHTAELLDKIMLMEGDKPHPELPSVVKQAPWLAYMRAITGTRELPGEANSPIIMSWNADIARAYPEMANYTRSYTRDLIPWCGQCMAACMVHCNPPVRPPFVKGNDTKCYLWADSWTRWGKELTNPITGCIMTFSRTGGNHVAILERMDGSNYCYVRGGNQSDMVNVTRRSMSGFKSARWPDGWHVANDLVASISNAAQGGTEA